MSATPAATPAARGAIALPGRRPAGARRLRPLRRPLLVIENPAARRAVRPRTREAVLRALAAGYRVDTAATAHPGHATALAAEAAAAGHELVAALGGDGTVNEVANGLAGTAAALACLPGGRTNVFARVLGLPRDAAGAAAWLARAAIRPPLRRVDLGTMNGRHFTFGSGIGLSAAVNRALAERPEMQAGLTHWYVAAKSLAVAAEYLGRRPRMRLTAGGRTVDALALVVQNADPLTYFGPRPLRPCAGAGLETGGVSIVALTRAAPVELVTVPPRVFLGGEGAVARHPRVASFPSVAGARVESLDGEPLAVEVDGEYVGEEAAVAYGVAARALRVVAPPG